MIWKVTPVASAMLLSKVNLSSCHWRLLGWICVSGMPSPYLPGHKKDDQHICLSCTYQPAVMTAAPIALPHSSWRCTACFWDLFSARCIAGGRVRELVPEVCGSLATAILCPRMQFSVRGLCQPGNHPFKVCCPLHTLHVPRKMG